MATFFFRFNKKKHQNDWFVKAAREMDMELEEDKLYPLLLYPVYDSIITILTFINNRE